MFEQRVSKKPFLNLPTHARLSILYDTELGGMATSTSFKAGLCLPVRRVRFDQSSLTSILEMEVTPSPARPLPLDNLGYSRVFGRGEVRACLSSAAAKLSKRAKVGVTGEILYPQ